MAKSKTTKKKTIAELNGKPLAVTPTEAPDPMAVLIVSKNPVGRPSEMTIATVTKLLAAFSNDYTIEQACAYSGIARTTYYRWLDENPYFKDKMEEAKNAPLRRAREVVIETINAGDANLAFRYLERRDPEFKPKAEVDNNIGLQETRAKIKDFLDDDSPNDSSEQPPTANTPDVRGEVAEAPTDIS